MQYALVDDIRAVATPGSTGVCPCCSAPVIAKCGTYRIWHWSHKGRRSCDPWWEPETAWHRAWKGLFPVEDQEVIHHDEVGTRHIADVRTKQGLVLEFQHSRIDPIERAIREDFYGNMVWVVDGMRLQGDLPRLYRGLRTFTRSPIEGISICRVPAKAFPQSWLDATKLVVFDFGAIEEERGHFWCLLPGRPNRQGIVARIDREDFIRRSLSHPEILPIEEIVAQVGAYIRQLDNQATERLKLEFRSRYLSRQGAY